MSGIKEWKERIRDGKLDGKLLELYVDEKQLARQRERYEQALTEFAVVFGGEEPGIELYSAPGRSEVGGNHTDHQRGEVLAAAVNLDALAVVRKVEKPVVRLQSAGYPMITVELSNLEPKKSEIGTSAGLIRGMAHGLAKNGYSIGGFEAYVVSDVLGGAGLSSSAAFEVLVGTILSGLYNEMAISPVEIAQVAQYAENVYFGKPCGLMDQMACSVGGLIHIDFKDGAHPKVEKVDVDFAAYGHSLCITDTKGSHADLTDEYAAVPAEMKQVAGHFGKEVLRELEPEAFYAEIPALRKKLGDRPVLRAIHFFQENERVEKQVSALKKGDFPGFLRLIRESGNSSFCYLQNVYTSRDVRNQAVSVGLAVSSGILPGHGASRVHGGGFAGTIQAFVENDFVETYRKALDGVYGPGSCHVLKVRPFGGVRFN